MINVTLTQVFETPYEQEPQMPIPEMNVGETVYHNKFGKGIVTNVYGDKCEILFSTGLRTLLTRFAKLQKH
jgi:hypothetical protein